MNNIMAQNFVFIWYDMVHLNITAQNLCFYHVIWHTLMIIIMAQDFVFIWYDMAYPNDYYKGTKLLFIWYDKAYSNIIVQNFLFMV